ncbi:MAG TPA: hypothetical protein VIM07_07735 [Chitinophagaceae bacterium]
MKKVNIAFLFLTCTFFFVACTNRDENGSTDTSNTNASHSVTDSTRGNNPKSNTVTNAPEKHLDSSRAIHK